MIDQNSAVNGEEHTLQYELNRIIIMFYDYMK